MTEMTMGQRIAECRKKLSLSQEGLGEKMGVSRQAISKWESDSAIPDIDKLIALSKLFGVSVGWLLGVEEDGPQPSGGLTEDQLKTVEEIVRRYQPRKEPDRLSPIFIGALCLLAVGIVIVLFWNVFQRNDSADYQLQLNQLSYNYSSIQSQLDRLAEQVDKMIQSESLLSSYEFSVTPAEGLTGVTVRFTGIPNTTGASDEAYLSVRQDGVEVTCEPCVRDGSGYTAAVDLAPANGYSYYFLVVHQGGASSQQQLEDADWECREVLSALRGQVYIEIGSWEFSGDLLTLGSMDIQLLPPVLSQGSQSAAWTQADLVLYYNEQELDRYSLSSFLEAEIISNPDGSQEETCTSQFGVGGIQFQIPALSEGDELELRLEGALSNTLEVAQPVYLWLMENGSLECCEFAIVD